MGYIIHMRGDSHRQTQALLPWYSNGTLDPDEVALVEAHLAQCSECQADLVSSRELGQQISRLSMNADHSLQELRERTASARPRQSAAPVSFLGRPISVGWALAAQLAVAVLIVTMTLPGRLAPVERSYHGLGSAPATQTGNVLVVFRPDASERDLRNSLMRSKARLVDGPTAGGAYLLRVETDGRDAALKQLRAAPDVVLAEPIDAGGRP
jgi:Putative zinc-finger